eukprot:14681279-Ditylum_brightwellii.AAC.1
MTSDAENDPLVPSKVADQEGRSDRLKGLLKTKSARSKRMVMSQDDDVEKGISRGGRSKVSFGGVDESLVNGLDIRVTEERPTQRRGEDLSRVHDRMS